LRSEIINLRQQLAEKAAATPVLRQQITILEKNLEEKAQETFGTPKSTLGSKINQLEEERTEPQPPTTPVPKLRERIRTLEEELEHEHTKNQTEQTKIMQTLHKIEAELQTKTDALQLKTRDFEQLLKDRAVDTVETPGTPAAVLHSRIKLLQEQSSQLTGTPPAQLRKKIHNLEAECKHVEEELNELREFTTLEKQMIEEGKVEELHRELLSLKKTLEDYEQMCTDLRSHNSELSAQNENLSEAVNELQKSVQSLTRELETNRAWNSKANEQQLLWKKELVRSQIFQIFKLLWD
jgi:chromosome segregation ATPase